LKDESVGCTPERGWDNLGQVFIHIRGVKCAIKSKAPPFEKGTQRMGIKRGYKNQAGDGT